MESSGTAPALHNVMKTAFRLAVVCLCISSSAFCDDTNTISATNSGARSGPELIRHLEYKADGYEGLLKEIARLEKELQRAKAVERGGRDTPVAPKYGLLEQLEQKAAATDAMAKELAQRNQDVAELKAKLAIMLPDGNPFLSENDKLLAQIGEMSNTVGRMSMEIQGLRATIDQLLLGNFEYYEVKEGDTFELISAQPLVYGDSSRQGWLKQANAGRMGLNGVLKPGQIIVIPRFETNRAYIF